MTFYYNGEEVAEFISKCPIDNCDNTNNINWKLHCNSFQYINSEGDIICSKCNNKTSFFETKFNCGIHKNPNYPTRNILKLILGFAKIGRLKNSEFRAFLRKVMYSLIEKCKKKQKDTTVSLSHSKTTINIKNNIKNNFNNNTNYNKNINYLYAIFGKKGYFYALDNEPNTFIFENKNINEIITLNTQIKIGKNLYKCKVISKSNTNEGYIYFFNLEKSFPLDCILFDKSPQKIKEQNIIIVDKNNRIGKLKNYYSGEEIYILLMKDFEDYK